MRKAGLDFFFSLWSSIHMLNSLSISFISLGHVLIDFTKLEVIDLSFILVALSLKVPNVDFFMPVAQERAPVLSHFFQCLKLSFCMHCLVIWTQDTKTCLGFLRIVLILM